MSYPTSLDALPTNTLNSFSSYGATDPLGNVEGPHAKLHNDKAAAINAIQGELGLSPSGTRATVKARLDSMDVDRVLCSAPGVAPAVGWVAGWRVWGERTLANFRGSAFTAQTGGSVIRWEVKRNGTSVFTTKPTLDNTETTTVTATTPHVFDADEVVFADNDRIDFYIDQVGDGTARELEAAVQWA